MGVTLWSPRQKDQYLAFVSLINTIIVINFTIGCCSFARISARFYLAGNDCPEGINDADILSFRS